MAARQEVLNVHLASLLSKLGYPTQAERRRKYAPDIIISHHFLGILLGEAEIAEVWDERTAREKLRKRIGERFTQPQFSYIDFLALIVYPKKLLQKIETKTENKVEEELAKAKIGFGLAYRRYPTKAKFVVRWFHAPINVTQLPSVLEEMTKDVVGLTSEEITEDLIGIIEEAGRMLPSIKAMRRAFLEKALDLDIEPEIFESKNDCANLTVKTVFTLGGVALLIYELARVRNPLELHDLSPLNVNKLIQGLKRVRQINYVEIIDSAVKAWSDLPSDPQLNQLLNSMYEQIKKGIDIVRRGGWDVLAFIYQRLLSETYRKTYATFYTKLPAAYLLANLAVETEKDKIIDPACGTGSLLVSGFFVKKRDALRPAKIGDLLVKKLTAPILDYVNKNLLRDIYGLDALETAVSLSSGALTLASLAVPRDRLRLFDAPIGPENSGSLDLLRTSIIKSNHHGITLKTKTRRQYEKVENHFDAVIMNPPFTRSDRIPTLIGDRARKDLTKQNLKFAGTKTTNLFAAGLAKPFLVLADRLCKNKGRLAMVLPNSILGRDSWADIRKGIVNSYAIEYVVISFAPGVPNFSSDTQFREILLVLRKRQRAKSEAKTKILNLFTPIDELKLHEIDALTYGVKAGRRTIVLAGKSPRIVATTREFDWELIKSLEDNWYRLVAFKNLDLTEHHLNVIENHCVPLSTYFTPGSVVDHTSGLDILNYAPKSEHFDAVWGSGEKSGILTLRGAPHHFLVITNRNEIRCRLWGNKYASNMMILRRGQLDTQYTLMFQLDKKAVSNVWWPLHPVKHPKSEYTTALLAFMNSTLGIIHMLGERLETRGLWIEFKKGQLANLPIPDFEKVGSRKLRRIFPEKDVSFITTARLPRIRDYIHTMSKLEARLGDHSAVIREASENPLIKSRVLLDKSAMELLDSLGYESVPKNMYRLLDDEIEVLGRIMESRRGRSSIKDKGAKAIKKVAEKSQKKILEWSKSSS